MMLTALELLSIYTKYELREEFEMKTVISRIDLGLTWIAGYVLYDEDSREFQETTPKEVKALIIRGQVNGLKLINSNIELDTDGFTIQNLMIKSGVGKYRALLPMKNMMNCMYAVVRVIDMDSGTLYETVSNKHARVKMTFDQLTTLMKVGYVAGVKLSDDGIELCKGVTYVDKRTASLENKATSSSLQGNSGITDDNAKQTADAISQKESGTIESIFQTLDVTSDDAIKSGSDSVKVSIHEPEHTTDTKAADNKKGRKK
jgi:hypothetical protein